MRIGVPGEEPVEAIAALKAFFTLHSQVRQAKLGLMEVLQPDGGSYFTYTVGWLASSDEASIKQKVLEVLQTAPMGRWPISIVPVTDQFFTSEAPVFYTSARQASKRSKLGFFAKIFNAG